MGGKKGLGLITRSHNALLMGITPTMAADKETLLENLADLRAENAKLHGAMQVISFLEDCRVIPCNIVFYRVFTV